MMAAKNHRTRRARRALLRRRRRLHALGHDPEQGAAPCGEDAAGPAPQSAAAATSRPQLKRRLIRSCCRRADKVIEQPGAPAGAASTSATACRCSWAGELRRRAHARGAAANGKRDARCTADHFVIATGSRPYHPPELDFTHPRIRDSDTILRYDRASVLGDDLRRRRHRLRVRVDLPEPRLQGDAGQHAGPAAVVPRRRDRRGAVVPPARAGLRDPSQRAVRQRSKRASATCVLHLKSGRKIKSDLLLWANGRTGNSDGMDLEALGLAPNQRGQIEVNEHYQTGRAARLRGRRHHRAAGAGERGVRAGSLTRCSTSLDPTSTPPHRIETDPERHLHDSGDLLGRPHRARAAGGQASRTKSATRASRAWRARR